MGTVPEPQPEEETPVEVFIHRAETVARLLIAGHEYGAVRRIVLYCIAMAGTGFAVAFGTLSAVIALVALMLLATTDDLR
ncbi:MAG TPA: hypothetical protein VFI40_04835 [Nocardioides sp.]|nr:hypothetical protein [Nocardioides sp.]